MADVFNKKKRSEIMSRIGRKDTAPEIRVRCLLHALGFRFRLHRSDLPGKPDIILPGTRRLFWCMVAFGMATKVVCALHCRKQIPNFGEPRSKKMLSETSEFAMNCTSSDGRFLLCGNVN
jgi:G:T-mismatch repair DNA endonuclease (very short patch repair protein)